MAELKTKQTSVNVECFLNKVGDSRKREDSFTILRMMKDVTGLEPKMWGPSMVGFGFYHYKYDSGHEGDCFMMGFSPRKSALTLYITSDLGRFEAMLKKLGKHKTGKSCLYIKKLADVDVTVLRKMMETGFAMISKTAQQNKRATPLKKARKKA
jgi:hypothetical protein